MTATLRIYWYILRTSITERLTYRGDFMFATLVRFLPLVTQIFLWGAVFGVDSAAPRAKIHNYDFRAMVAYYLLANLGRAFSSMPGLAGGIAREIRDGTIKRYLTQPVDMLGYLFWARTAHKLVYYTVATIPFGIVFFLCRHFFTAPIDSFEVLAFIVSLFLAFLLGFLIESLIGLTAFWFMEVNSLIFIFMMFNYFLSGHMLPLDYLQAYLRPELVAALDYLPFGYLSYIPAAIMLHRYDHAQIAQHLAAASLWVLILFGLNRIVFHLGVRRYSAYGG